MRNFPFQLKNRILEENIKVHQLEAPVYEKIHPEIFGFWEQRRVKRDVLLMKKLLNIPSSALDIGCGTGNLLFKLKKAGFQVTGVDISSALLKRLQQKPDYISEIKLYCQPVDDFFSENPIFRYNLITFFSVLHHLPNYYFTLTSAKNFLAKDGIIYIAHEPLFESRQDIIGRIDSKFFRILKKIEGITIPRIDYQFADFHSGSGIDLENLCKFLKRSGFEIITKEKYCSRKTAFFIFLSKLLSSSPNNFKVIAQLK